jgi:hypothetical protein
MDAQEKRWGTASAAHAFRIAPGSDGSSHLRRCRSSAIAQGRLGLSQGRWESGDGNGRRLQQTAIERHQGFATSVEFLVNLHLPPPELAGLRKLPDIGVGRGGVGMCAGRGVVAFGR